MVVAFESFLAPFNDTKFGRLRRTHTDRSRAKDQIQKGKYFDLSSGTEINIYCHHLNSQKLVSTSTYPSSINFIVILAVLVANQWTRIRACSIGRYL